MFPSPRIECASVEQTIFTPAASASRTCPPERSSRSGRPFTSSATPVSSATSKTRSRSSAFSGRWLRIRPFGCERHDAAGCAHRLDDPVRQRLRGPSAGRRGG